MTMKKSKLLIAAAVKFISGIVLTGALLFIPAGTLHYPNAWLFMGLLFAPMLVVGIVLFIKSPAMLEKRLNSKETEKGQGLIVMFFALIFIAVFIVAALDFRYEWLKLPLWLVIAASVLMVVGYALWAEVMRENAFLSRTVEIQEEQTVVDTGLYGIVRHPMYFAALLLFTMMPLVLGSLVAFIIGLGIIPVFVQRIHGEEKLLEKELAGYTEYEKKVRYRLIPYIW